MKRQITIYESAQNGKITVFNDVECNTLSELKTLLREKNINYSGMEFIEGVTNTKLLSDDSRIPTDIPFKGKVTNNVFINILKKDSKIDSGVDLTALSRSELLKLAKEFADDIYEIFHRNFTQVKSCDIVEFLEKNLSDEGWNEEKHEETEGFSNLENNTEITEIPLVEALVTFIKAIGCEEPVYEALALDIEIEPEKEKDDADKSAFSAEDIANFVKQ